MKRDREIEELDPEFLEMVKEHIMKKRKKEMEQKSNIPVFDLTQSFNEITKDIVDEKGFQVKTEENDLLIFSATLYYPNEIDYLEIYPRIFAVDRGVADIDIELLNLREARLSIYYTRNKALRLTYKKKHEKEHQALRELLAQNGAVARNRDAVYLLLAENLKLSPLEPKFNTSRPSVDGVKTVTVSVGVENLIRSAQLQKIYAGHDDKIKAIRIDPHPDEPVLRVSVDIYYEA